jgi:hypothetical protein
VESSALRRVTNMVICLHFLPIPSAGIVLHRGHPSRLGPSARNPGAVLTGPGRDAGSTVLG